MRFPFAAFTLFATSAALAGGKDPRTRDEDVSGMSITSKVERVGDEMFRYIYTIKGGANAIGTITNIKFDVFCPGMPDLGDQDIDDADGTMDFDMSRDGRHVPLTSKLIGSPKRDAGFQADNLFRTLIMLFPKSTRTVELLSPNAPGYVHFQTSLSSEHEADYDYTELWEKQGDVPDIPWYEDWEVQGLVKGPACPGREATPMTRPIFDGQRLDAERREVNALLRYEIPGNRNRFHAPATQTSVKLRVYYDYQIDPVSFTATLNGRDIRALFHPAPGMNEYVTLPLEGARTVIDLSVGVSGDQFDDVERYHTRIDRDPFEIRRPVTTSP